jgi:hypothetical protein
MCFRLIFAFLSRPFQAARKAKNRLSSALLVAGDNTEEVPKSHKRRPTVSRHKPKTSIPEENLVEVNLRIDADVKKVEEVSVSNLKERSSPMVTKKTRAPAPPKSATADLGKTTHNSILRFIIK